MFKEGGYFGHSKEMASDSDSFLRKTKENEINNTDYDDTNLRLRYRIGYRNVVK